jgi:hypothetical protein
MFYFLFLTASPSSNGTHKIKIHRKMRKPDPPPGTAAESLRRKRSSAAALMTVYKPPSSSSSLLGFDGGIDADVDTEARSSLEMPPVPPLSSTSHALPLRGVNGGYINPELFPLPPSRPGSAAAMYSPGPPTRTTGSTTSDTSSSNSTTAAVKRKKSRPRLVHSDEENGESDGAEADAEYVGGSGGGKGTGSWVNVEGRRKAVPKRSAATAAVAAIEDIRRHSMAI